MMLVHKSLVILGLAAGVVGCSHNDKPHEYGQQRPPVDQLDGRDRGLQSKDLVASTDTIAMEILAMPELNASQAKWTIVAMPVENQTTAARANYDIFIDRLKTSLFKHGRGRVALIENRDRYRDMQNRELDPAAREREDSMGQTGVSAGSTSAGTQPDYALYAKMQELPNRATSLYRIEFNITKFAGAGSREMVYSGEYLTRVER
ncbi:MAG TPA: hypothetical protein PLD59_11430 [Tepidisphaeraceae bacterium]|nr:hypothetical protein [Tepidisphaeraceae bacterium]